MGTIVHDLWKLAAKMPDDPTLRAMIENGARELEELQAEIARLQDWKRKQMEDIMDLGQQVGRLEVANAKLRAALEPLAAIVQKCGKDHLGGHIGDDDEVYVPCKLLFAADKALADN